MRGAPADCGVLEATLLPLLVATVIILTGALVTTGSGARRAAGLAVTLTSMACPWVVPGEHSLVRAIYGLIATAGCARVADLCRGDWSIGSRLRHVASPADSRTLVRVPRRIVGARLAAGLGWLVLGLAAGGLVYVQTETLTVGYWARRWVAGAVGVYAVIEAGYALAHVAYSAVGLEPLPLHVVPILSRSVQELWGQRWARPVSRWLGDYIFRPLARRRRPVLGALLAFGASAAFHAYGAWVGLGLVKGLPMAACVLAYFLVQAVVIAMERRLGVRKWAPWAGHVWTVGWMLITAPLFVEPAAEVILHGSPPDSRD
jgi:hypothetical protein